MAVADAVDPARLETEVDSQQNRHRSVMVSHRFPLRSAHSHQHLPQGCRINPAYCKDVQAPRRIERKQQVSATAIQTWKCDDETHLAICRKRGSTILRNSAGSITSSSSSISPRNITWHTHRNASIHRVCQKVIPAVRVRRLAADSKHRLQKWNGRVFGDFSGKYSTPFSVHCTFLHLLIQFVTSSPFVPTS